jgi:asparagine synthase (glutamine-hydrolysing)
MCGIAGIVRGTVSSSSSSTELRRLADGMGGRLVHRGPDAGGAWSADGDPVGLAHRRLSILDLSAEGSQPMTSHCGRFVIVYNGEVFNFRDLKAAVERSAGHVAWRGHSDTEILLQAIATLGLEAATALANGMFAFALWDRREQTLHLVRDRLGKKPLYFAQVGPDLVFGSEVRALAAHPQWQFVPDREALLEFLRRGYIPAPRTGLLGVAKLEPGTILTLTAADVRQHSLPPAKPYWHPESVRVPVLERGARPDDLESLLSKCVADRMVADVPVGAFLSGGIDSTLIVALMVRLGGAGLRSFTIGFGGDGQNEAEQAAAVARHLGTQHEELVLGARETVDLVPTVVDAFDEPFGDSSAIPTWLVSRLAAQHAKVVLSGDGADELFGGYTRYDQNDRIWRALRYVPPVAAAAVARLGGRAMVAPGAGRWRSLLAAAAAPDAAAFYRVRTSHVLNPAFFAPGTRELALRAQPPGPLRGNIQREMMYQDLVTYLPDDILAKVDRASMAHSLEVRSPFLDDRMVEFAWGLGDSEVTGARGGKALLRELLYRLVPRALVDRPKTGFGLPLEQWLAAPLRDWAESHLLRSSALADAGFDRSAVAGVWQGFIGGRQRLAGAAWNLVLLSVWLDRQRRELAS